MLIAFDLDGTLIEARDVHYRCFNSALELAGVEPISYDEHLRRFDGLPSAKKMQILIDEGRMPDHAWRAVESEKRRLTIESIVPDGPIERISRLFDGLRAAGHRTAVVSNARWETVGRIVDTLRISPDVVISNEDVARPKPNPEGYLRAMVQAGESPATTLVLEDAPAGKIAARASGARLVPVFDPEDLTLEEVMRYIHGGTSFDVVMPMAGEGKRFRDAGYVLPKPLVSVEGTPMAGVATNTLGLREARYVYLVSSSHLRDWATGPYLRSLAKDVEIVEVDRLTEGAACTVLLARDLINHDRPVVVANCDQWLSWDPDAALHRMVSLRAISSVLTFDGDGSKKWSYAKVNDQGIVLETAEKQPISDRALCGVFMYRRGRDLVESLDHMIRLDDRTNGEFYVAPSLNYLPGQIIEQRAEMRGLGTPEDLEVFLRR